MCHRDFSWRMKQLFFLKKNLFLSFIPLGPQSARRVSVRGLWFFTSVCCDRFCRHSFQRWKINREKKKTTFKASSALRMQNRSRTFTTLSDRRPFDLLFHSSPPPGYGAVGFENNPSYGHTASHHTPQFSSLPFKHEDALSPTNNLGRCLPPRLGLSLFF